MNSRSRVAPVLASVSGFIVLLLLAMWLRTVPSEPNPVLHGYLQITTGLLAFVFAALILVRFQGTQDRISLILGAGFLLSGTVLIASSLLFFQFQQNTQVQLRWASVSWWFSRVVLALLFVVALLVEHFLPRSRHPLREIAGALLTVMASTYLITATLRRIPTEVSQHPAAVFPSPQQLLPAGIFLVALLWFRHRLKLDDSAFDSTIYAAAWINLGAQLAASQSQRMLDSPSVLAQALTVTSYAVALGGALLDNARLFDRVRQLAISDPLTGLVNYRRLRNVLEAETERTDRNGRPFAVLLLDLDDLKKINDTHGHLVGSHALNRLAHILRLHCRAVDTAARYGGDEFALVLPETLREEAELVANRIRAAMASDAERPQLSASIGISIYNGHGERIEKVLSDADAELYTEKAGRDKKSHRSLIPRSRAQKA
jgi:diguanylate cyclase (GGDEF)-like protein